jgi:hypothetical protein
MNIVPALVPVQVTGKLLVIFVQRADAKFVAVDPCP